LKIQFKLYSFKKFPRKDAKAPGKKIKLGTSAVKKYKY